MVLATLESELMDEPCDWDVCTEASAPDAVSQLLSRSEKKRRSKPTVSVSDPIEDQAVEHRSHIKADKTPAAPRKAPHVEETPKQTTSTRAAPQQSSSHATPTRKELQDALPKIPPLSSFKNCSLKFVTFKEAERDFQAFITTGLGRSVEVVREFRGEDQKAYKEIIMLHDDGTQDIAQSGEQLHSDVSPRSSVSYSSDSDDDDVAPGGLSEPTEAEHRPPGKPQPDSTSTAQKPSTLKIHKQTSRVLTPPESSEQRATATSPNLQTAPRQIFRDECKKVKSKSKKISGKKKGKPVKDEEEDRMDVEEEEEWDSETYWRAYYRSWSDYYSSMGSFPEQGYQSYYSAAQNWMAAYRMNAVYMQELMKH